jgi:hypothetical protein
MHGVIVAQFPQGAFAPLARNRLAQLQAALTPASPPAPPPLPSAAPAPPALRDALAVRLAAVSQQMTEQARNELTGSYERLRGRKALAVVPGTTRSWRVSSWATAALAEEKVLENCQAYYNQVCALVAVDDLCGPKHLTSAGCRATCHACVTTASSTPRIPGSRGA